MVTSLIQPDLNIRNCPHCSSNFITWDSLEGEPYCGNCGWRKAVRIRSDQARQLFRTERYFWLNLFTGYDEDENKGS